MSRWSSIPPDYATILAALEAGGTDLATRKRLAQKAYARTAVYDAAISNWMAGAIGETAPTWRAFGGRLVEALRYGENPHQQAAFYANGDTRPGVATARQLQGKALSYNNVNDTDAAIELIAEFPTARAGGRHHQTRQSLRRRDGGQSAGGLSAGAALRPGLGLRRHRRLEHPAGRPPQAREIVKIFTEVIVAPEADDEAIAIVAGKPNLRLLLTGALPDARAPGLTYAAGRRRLPCPGPRQCGRWRPRSQSRHQAGADSRRAVGFAVRLFRGETRQIECDRLR